MDYITLVHLAERPGAKELAQVATAQHLKIVDSALLDAALRGGDPECLDAGAGGGG
ncbi:hypothetical protein ACG3SK_27360 [Pseudomonas aeruginosa]